MSILICIPQASPTSRCRVWWPLILMYVILYWCLSLCCNAFISANVSYSATVGEVCLPSQLESGCVGECLVVGVSC
jgi:hypothetical protein